MENLNVEIPKIASNGNIELSQEEKDRRIELIKGKFEDIFEIMGFDIENDIQMKDTPRRAAKMYINELFKGTYSEPPKITVFENTKEYSEMVTLSGIQVKSLCSHHLMPFMGTATISYVPDKKVIGLSKLARITEWFARRPQIQEELTQQIANYIQDTLYPLGVGVYIEANHTCMSMRGANQPFDSLMKTTSLKGVFLTEPETRNEFMSMIKK
jgi:GTP cyclohydrolase I